MKNFIFVAALFVIGKLVHGALEMEPNSSQLLSNASVILQEECIAKVQNDSIKLNDISKFKLFFLHATLKVIKEYHLNEIPNTFEGVPEGFCNSHLDVDILYSLTMNITKTCMNEDENFTDEEKQTVKSKLKRIYCYGYIKFDDVCSNDEVKWDDLKKCTRQLTDTQKTIRDVFFGDGQSCRAKTKILDCGKKVLKGLCQPRIANQIESIFNELQKNVCETEPMSGDAINS